VPAPGLVAGALGGINPQVLGQVARRLGGCNNRWNQWVLNYSRGQQLALLKQLGFSAPSWEDLALLLIGVLSGLSLLGAAWGLVGPASPRPLATPGPAASGGTRLDRAERRSTRVAARPGPEAEAALRQPGPLPGATVDALELQRYGRAASPSAPWPARGAHGKPGFFGVQKHRTAASIMAAMPISFQTHFHATRLSPLLLMGVVGVVLTAGSFNAFSKPPKHRSHARKAPDGVAYGQRDDVMRFGAELAQRKGSTRPGSGVPGRSRASSRVAKFIMPPPAGQRQELGRLPLALR